MQKEQLPLIYIIKWFIIASIAFGMAIAIFGLGVWVGQERAEYSYRWAENYHKNFGGPQKGFFGNFLEQETMASHGIFGQVITTEGNNIMVEGQDHVEKTIVISEKTTLRNNAGEIQAFDIKADDTVVVIGSPNKEGQVEAKLIRVIPAE